MTATETLWREFRGPLSAFVRRRVASPEDAEDLVGEVFARLHEHSAELERVGDVRAWLYRVTRNAIVDHHRRARPTVSLDGEVAADVDLPEVPDDDHSAELAGCMERILRSLPEPDQQALWAIASGESQEQFGERAGLSPSGGRSRVQRARARLIESFRACCRVELDGCGRIVEWQRRNPDGRTPSC